MCLQNLLETVLLVIYAIAKTSDDHPQAKPPYFWKLLLFTFPVSSQI